MSCWVAAGVAFVLFGAWTAEAQVDVWIDTDPSIGMFLRDADDGFALIQAFRSPKLRIRGISSTYGNASLDATDAITRTLANRFGYEAGIDANQVFVGAANASELGKPTPASAALTSALGERRLIYIALGPLTNLATALKLRPELASRIERVIFLGGRVPGEHFRLGNRLPYEFHDANFEKDPRAALAVLRAPVAFDLVPLSASKQVLFTPADLAQIRRDGGMAGRFLEKNSRLWLHAWRTLFGLDGGPAFDCLAVLAVTHPEQFMERETNVCISGSSSAPASVALADSRQRSFLLTGALPSSRNARNVRVFATTKPAAKEKILHALIHPRLSADR